MQRAADLAAMPLAQSHISPSCGLARIVGFGSAPPVQSRPVCFVPSPDSGSPGPEPVLSQRVRTAATPSQVDLNYLAVMRASKRRQQSVSRRSGSSSSGLSNAADSRQCRARHHDCRPAQCRRKASILWRNCLARQLPLQSESRLKCQKKVRCCSRRAPPRVRSGNAQEQTSSEGRERRSEWPRSAAQPGAGPLP